MSKSAARPIEILLVEDNENDVILTREGFKNSKLLVNMSAVQYLSSAGLCALLNLGKVATATHGRLFLCSPSAQVKQILKLSGFDKILTIKDSVQDALVE